jgi:hypothetical protein
MKSCVVAVYIPGQYDESLNIQIAYTATTQDFM